MPTPEFDALSRAAESRGLALRGGFHPDPADRVPALPDGGTVHSVVLLGFLGTAQWPVFAASPEYADGRAHALDRWSRRVIDELGAAHGAVARYPSDGPPWLPFQHWALRSESIHRSPLGLLIHPTYGLWHSYRGALCFRTRLALPPTATKASPCDACRDKPCLNGCPVNAFTPAGYDAAACARHVAAPAGADCRQLSCRARRACPVGALHRYGPAQSLFHMAAFLGMPAPPRDPAVADAGQAPAPAATLRGPAG